MAERYITLHHYDSTVKTIEEFMEKNRIFGLTPDDFFESNRGLIFSQMSLDDKMKFWNDFGFTHPLKPSDLKVEMTLPLPCNLQIKSTQILRETAIIQNNTQIPNDDFYVFNAEQTAAIMQNEGYRAGGMIKKNLNCEVFGWFKSLYDLYENENGKTVKFDKTGWYDISKYIMGLSTYIDQNGGSFVITLPVIPFEQLKGRYRNFGSNVSKMFYFLEKLTYEYEFNGKSEFYAKLPYSNVEGNIFNWLISSNDLLMINFEKSLENTKPDDFADSNRFSIETDLYNMNFDMIGLVDEVRMVTDANSSTASIEITGRDLMKLIIEDGSYFFESSVVSKPNEVFVNEAEVNKFGDVAETGMWEGAANPLDRLRAPGGELEIFYNNALLGMDIGFVIKTVIARLVNIEVVPGYVFNTWKDKRTKLIELKPIEEKKS